jgi:hypothetical protein
MVEKNRDLLECERCQIFGNVRRRRENEMQLAGIRLKK